MLKLKTGRGRPKKFGRDARSITLTLPEDVIDRLTALDLDVGRAIVTLVERVRGRFAPRQPAEIATHGSHSVILVTPVPALSRLRGVQLVPVSAGRSLIALDRHHSIAQLELDLRDALERGVAKGLDRAVLIAVIDILKNARTSHGLTVAERSIIVLEGARSVASGVAHKR